MFAPHMQLLQGWSVGGVVVGGILSLAYVGKDSTYIPSGKQTVCY